MKLFGQDMRTAQLDVVTREPQPPECPIGILFSNTQDRQVIDPATGVVTGLYFWVGEPGVTAAEGWIPRREAAAFRDWLNKQQLD